MRNPLGFINLNDFSISTWLLFGASIQCLLVASLPRNVALLPPFALLLLRILRAYLQANGYLRNPRESGVTIGRHTWQIPSKHGSQPPATHASESVVVLVLAASWAHPNGRLSPGSEEVGGYFRKMWNDAETNREKYGYLGHTPELGAIESGNDKSTTTVTLSYWKTLDGLYAFTSAKAHMNGQLWWERGAMDEYPHIGIAHEVYEVPAGNWENVFHNFKPFGISATTYPVPSSVGETEKNGSTRWISGLRSADGKEWKDSRARMGRRL